MQQLTMEIRLRTNSGEQLFRKCNFSLCLDSIPIAEKYANYIAVLQDDVTNAR